MEKITVQVIGDFYNVEIALPMENLENEIALSMENALVYHNGKLLNCSIYELNKKLLSK